MKLRLIEGWDKEFWRLWSNRVAIFWCAIGSFVMVAALVSDEAKSVLGPWHFGLILFVASFSFSLARFLKQPGTEAEE